MYIIVKDGVISSKDNLQDGYYSIKKIDDIRSDAQNKYYWSVVNKWWCRILSQSMGGRPISPKDTHKILVDTYLSKNYINEDGTETVYNKNTSLMSKKEFSNYIEILRKEAYLVSGIHIPSPIDYGVM